MSQLYSQLLLGLSILVGSAIPLVPTGELVSGASALADHTVASVLVIFFISWSFSVAGDTLLLLEVRLISGRLQRWLDGGRSAAESPGPKRRSRRTLSRRFSAGGCCPEVGRP